LAPRRGSSLPFHINDLAAFGTAKPLIVFQWFISTIVPKATLLSPLIALTRPRAAGKHSSGFIDLLVTDWNESSFLKD
jgi:hypothetical protein